MRLHGIDAPEAGQTCRDAGDNDWDCGTGAMNRLAAMVEGRRVSCVAIERDAYGRIISRCTSDGIDLAETLVAEGLAWAFVRYSDSYVPVEAATRTVGLGIWAAENQAPWDYREARWERAAAEFPGRAVRSRVISRRRANGSITRHGRRITREPASTRRMASAGSATRLKRLPQAGVRRAGAEDGGLVEYHRRA